MVQLQKIASEEKGAIVSGPFGSNISAKYFVDEGIPVIRGNNLTKGVQKFIDDGFVYLTETKAAEFRNCIAIKDDIVFTAAGSIGQVGIIPENTKFEKYVISNKQLRVLIDKKKADPMFVYYWLSCPRMTGYLEGMNNGGAVPLLNLGIIRRIPVPLPPLDTQSSISAVVSNFNDLIDTNRRRIQLLEEAARLLFREWFVYFRFPSFAKASEDKPGHEKACPVESINSTGVKIVNGMPEGWRKRRLVEVADITMGQSPKSEYYNDNGEGLPFHQGVTGFGNRYPTNQTYCTQKNRMAQSGDILFSVRAPVGRINISTEKIIIGRGISAIRSKENHQSYLFYELKNHFFKEDMIGGGAIFAAITKKDLETVVTIVPDEKAIDKFENITNPIDRQIFILSNQNQKLAQARDLLLPRLMSGAIEV